MSDDRFIGVHGVTADTLRNQFLREGEAVAVEPRVMELFVYLAKSPGRIVTKAELREQVWRAHVVDEAIHRAVSLLRAAIGDTAKNPIMLETVPRQGYRLIAPPAAPAPRALPFWQRRSALGTGAAAALLLVAIIAAVSVSGPDAISVAEQPVTTPQQPRPIGTPKNSATAAVRPPDDVAPNSGATTARRSDAAISPTRQERSTSPASDSRPVAENPSRVLAPPAPTGVTPASGGGNGVLVPKPPSAAPLAQPRPDPPTG